MYYTHMPLYRSYILLLVCSLIAEKLRGERKVMPDRQQQQSAFIFSFRELRERGPLYARVYMYMPA